MAYDFEPILMELYRFPTITAYNRLEPRPRDTKFDRSLKAEVRDAVWMLGRQWQTGEFIADDAGSASKVKLYTKKFSIDKIGLRQQPSSEYDTSIPMETRVEREVVPVTLQLRIEMGNFLIKLLKQDNLIYVTVFLEKFKLASTIQAEEIRKIEEEKESSRLFILLKNRCIDGYQVYTDILSGSYNAWINGEPGINHADVPGLIKLGDEFVLWYNSLFAQPQSANDTAWDNSRLEYQFNVTARQSSETSIALSADQYYTGELDWYAFNWGIQKESVDPHYKPNEEVISFMPSHVTFKGMPHARYWEMEERQTNFGAISASTTGLLHMLLAEFGLIYSNDWIVIPYKIPVNTICKIEGIIVTDVFGDRTLINPAGNGINNTWQKWAMYNLSAKHEKWPGNNCLFLPPTLTRYLESEPLEKVNFMRDEMANMVWAVEEVVPSQLGKGMSGKEQALAADKKEEEEFTSTASIRYILGTTVPSNWIPFIPVHKTGNTSEVVFQRAQMPAIENTGNDGYSEFNTIKPRGVILTEVKQKYCIQEEEIPKSGIIVKRTFQRTRWFDGKTYLWLGRRKETGRGQGYSGLMFDQIKDTKKKEE